jgi:cystathionine beta-lyase
VDWLVDTPWISYSPGVVNSIYYLVQALCEPGDGVIVQNPVYGPFRSVIKDAKCNWINNQMLKIQGPRGPYYQMDLEDLEKKAADPKNKILLLCSPSNPGGRVWTMEELTAVRDICHRHEVFVISDEIHGDLIFPGERHIPWGLMDSTENWAVLISPSKTFNVPGLGTSFCIIKNKKLRDQFNLIKYHNHGAMENPFGLVAAKAAYAKASPWLNELKEYLKGNYELIDRSIPDNIKLYRQEGSYLAWMDVSSMGSVKKIKEYFYEQRSLGVQLGEDFGPGGEGHVRLNFALPSRVLKEILKRIN